MKSAITIIKEQINSFYLIKRLSVYEIKSANSNNYLGILWEFINPLIQISIYWFVFGLGLRKNSNVEIGGTEVPFIIWMLSGIIVWFFINQAITQGSKSIYSRIKLISKMSFPMSAIPTYVIMSKFYSHIMLVVAITIIFQVTGFPISIYFLQLPYYMFATIALMLSLALITSTISTIVRDVQMAIQSLTRVLIYLTPFLWTPDRLPEWIQHLMPLNPLYYIAQGYRSALLGKTGWYFIDHAGYSLYFWAIVFVLFIFGSFIHLKFRDHFVDYL